MIDLVIRGDTVVTPEGVGAHDILIAGGTIAAIAAPNGIAVPEGTRVIDATGKIVIPGGIDPHVHCKWHLPGPDGSATLTEPPDVVSKAAVHGGTTTMIDFTRASQGKRRHPRKGEGGWAGQGRRTGQESSGGGEGSRNIKTGAGGAGSQEIRDGVSISIFLLF